MLYKFVPWSGLTAALSLISLILGAPGARSATYSVTDLGVLTDLSGRTDAKPNGINSAGGVAEANVISGAYRALVYGGAWTNLETLGGGESLGASINDSNLVVGSSSTASGSSHAFLWTPGGKDGVSGNPQMKDLGTLGGSTSEGAAINRSGQVTGYSDISAGAIIEQHAFAYRNGTMTDIGKLLNSLPNSFGYGINASGHIAGTAYNASYAQPHAFFYNGTTASDIGSIGGAGATALSINDADHIVGYFDTNSFTRAFHYSNGTMTDLGTLGGDYSYAIGINNSNVIVGGSFTDATASVYHAFIWTEGTISDLNTEMDATGSGWTLIEARAINDAGQIVGVGTYGGNNHTFLLTPKTSGVTVPAPTIVTINLSGSNVVLQFTTVSSGLYSVQACGTLGSTWNDVVTGIPGTGGTVSVTNAGGASFGTRFYRVSAASR